LPVFWEDNYVSTSSEGKRVLQVEFDLKDLSGRRPLLKVDGWNVKRWSKRIKIMKNYLQVTLMNLFLGILILTIPTLAGAQKLPFRVLVVASPDPDHGPMIIQSKAFLEKIGSENNFRIDFTRDATLINKENLADYQVLVQLQTGSF